MSDQDKIKGEAPDQENSPSKIQRANPITKLQRIINLLENLPDGLNRFEAERSGEHCLNSTVSVIREIYGNRLFQKWETVPTRYCPTGVRVLRYWLLPEVK